MRRWAGLASVGLAVVLVLLGGVWAVFWVAGQTSAIRGAVSTVSDVVAAIFTAVAGVAAFAAALESRRAAQESRDVARNTERALALHRRPGVLVEPLWTRDGDDLLLRIRVDGDPRKDLKALRWTVRGPFSSLDEDPVEHPRADWPVDLLRQSTTVLELARLPWTDACARIHRWEISAIGSDGLYPHVTWVGRSSLVVEPDPARTLFVDSTGLHFRELEPSP